MNVPFFDLTRQWQAIRDEVLPPLGALLDSQKFILGAPVEELENDLAAHCGFAHAVGCASGSDALLLALMALEVGPGDEVITTPFTFFATAGAICRTGAKPVFVDIKPDTFNIDPDKIGPAITPATKAIMPVHLYGQCADMDAIVAIAREHNLRVIEDCAQAIGATHKGRPAGTMGDIGAFSFFPTKNLGGFGDGGFCTAGDPELAALLRSLRVHGQATDMRYMHRRVGFNSRLDALQAVVLRVKLRHLAEWNEARRANAAFYDSHLPAHGLRVPAVVPDRHHVYHQYVIRHAQRDALREHLSAQGVGCTVYYPLGLHLQECFASLGGKQGDLPECEQACREVLALPVFPELMPDERQYLVDGVADFAGGT